MRPWDRVVQEVAELDPILLLRDMEVGIGPVQLGGAVLTVEGVQVQVQRIGPACLTELEEGLPLDRGVNRSALLLEVASVLV
eukprot:5672918-Alexandrium_andersonii.AAC.1